jgi:lipase chaperone LimK
MRTGSSSRASDPAAPTGRWGRALLAGALLAGLAAGGYHLFPASPSPRAAAPGSAARVPTPRPALPGPRPVATARAAAGPTAAPTLPASLRGTAEDGALRVDDDGYLVIGPGVLRFFDYYLTATGEESPAVLRGRIVAAVHRRLSGAGQERAAGQAVALLDTYLGYREVTRRLRPDGDDPAARLAALHDLRRRSFGAEVADKLFGGEERVLAVDLARRRLLADRDLPPAERERRLAAMEAELPDAVRRAHAEATRPLRERADEEAMRADGASDDDLRAYRAAAEGDEAADRLAVLDLRRADWQRRLAVYRAARAAILSSEADPARQGAAVKQLLDASFTPLEQIRVEAAAQMSGP